MNRKEKTGLLAFLIAMLNILGVVSMGKDPEWYALIVLLIGSFLFLFGGDDE